MTINADHGSFKEKPCYLVPRSTMAVSVYLTLYRTNHSSNCNEMTKWQVPNSWTLTSPWQNSLLLENYSNASNIMKVSFNLIHSIILKADLTFICMMPTITFICMMPTIQQVIFYLFICSCSTHHVIFSLFICTCSIHSPSWWYPYNISRSVDHLTEQNCQHNFLRV